MKKLVWLLSILFLIGMVSALPTTNPAAAVGNNNFTLSATGCAATGCWFQYGLYADRLMIWTNTYAPIAGTVTKTEFGAPIQTSTTYYAAACDSTGCGNVVSFTTLAYTPLPLTTFGAVVNNMTESKFNILFMIPAILLPYTWLFPANMASTAISIVCGMLFFFIFVGFWIRQRGVGGAVIIGLLTASVLLYSNKGLNLGIPVEFQAIAQALLYASLAGIFLIFLKR